MILRFSGVVAVVMVVGHDDVKLDGFVVVVVVVVVVVFG